MTQFSLREYLLAPLLLLICVGFVEGAGSVKMLLDEGIEYLFDRPIAQGWGRQILNSSSTFNSYLFWVFNSCFSWLIVAGFCYALGRLYIRFAQVLAFFMVVSVPIGFVVPMALWRPMLSSWNAKSYAQYFGAALTGLCICALAWYIGYRKATRQLQHRPLEGVIARNRKFLVVIVALICLVSVYGWQTLGFIRAMEF